MRRFLFRIASSLVFVGIILQTSCTPAPKKLKILTDRTEMASAVEIYRGLNRNIIITLHHVSSVNASILQKEQPDLVIASHLNAPELTRGFRTIHLSPPMYPALRQNNTAGPATLIPLSFEMPLVMGLQTTMAALPDAACVRPEELQAAAKTFIRRNKEKRILHLGFSPLWDALFLTDFLAARDITLFQEGWENTADAAIRPITEELNEWITDGADDINSEREFNLRYRYIPDEYLIMQERIQFARTDFSTWNRLPDTVSRNLDIRYLQGNRSIPVIRVVSAAIPQKNISPKTAEKFIQWLTKPETQKQLMGRWEKDGIQVFGFLGGLSANPVVNETVLQDRFPSFRGMIPENHLLAVPSTVPHRWKRIRNEVVAPWIIRELTKTDSATPTLSQSFRSWDLSSLTETIETE